MTRSHDAQDELRKDALTAFIEARVREGYRVETRTDTHAIITRQRLLDRLRKPKQPARQVISVDDEGEITMRPAEPLRS